MRLIFFILISFHLQAGVGLKDLNYKLYFKWVTPELSEMVEAYQKLLTKIDKDFEAEVKYIPWRGNFYYQYKSLLKTCDAKEIDITKCSEKIQSFKSDLTPFYAYWKKKGEESKNQFEKNLFEMLSDDLKLFLDIQTFGNIQDKKTDYPDVQKLLSLYTLPYPYLISKIKDPTIKEGIERLWGNVMEPIISKLLYSYNYKYLAKHIDKMNLQINETRMIWTKRDVMAGKYLKSINYIHYKWNIMLKSILKF